MPVVFSQTGKVTAMKFTKALTAALSTIVVATRADKDEFTNPKVGDKLSDNGYAVYMEGDADAHGNKPMRATIAGYEWYDAANAGNTPNAATSAATQEKKPMTFEIETGLKAPARTRNSSGSGKYPFDKLSPPEIKDGVIVDGTLSGFFVPKTDKMPEPIKSISSVVSAANRRYSRVTKTEDVDDGKGGTRKKHTREFDRKFSAARGAKEVDGKTVEGAWVYRVDNGELPKTA